ncbi:MAG TPA: isoprenylcysteine carboxylmethyltransferase family protein [Anaerolineales bacterium]|jgi:protein-S-isoprenylcysteine O-methyltransferase Ste14|nr:isoprenylcysteine carboxylmethyltransferase family protein [Anaerolineales bacterium]
MNTSPILIFIAILLYGGVHSILAALKTKALARQWFGKHTDRWYRLFFNAFGFVSFLPVLALPPLLTDTVLYRIPAPWSYLAIAGQVGAVIMLIAGLLQTDTLSFMGVRQFITMPHYLKEEKLVVNGLYRWVRHPLYTAGMLFIWLTPVMTVNWLALYIGVTIYTVIGAMFEERKLVKAFGKEYEEYRKRTPMLIPGLKWGE